MQNKSLIEIHGCDGCHMVALIHVLVTFFFETEILTFVYVYHAFKVMSASTVICIQNYIKKNLYLSIQCSVSSF